jgi:putative DNA primase/helicase
MKQNKEVFAKMLSLGFSYIKLKENVGNYNKESVVCVSSDGYDTLKNYYGELDKLTFEELESQKGDVVDLDLQYIISNNTKIKNSLKQEQEKDKTISELKQEVATCLLIKQRAEASEAIVNFFCKSNKVYAVRSDEKKEIWIYENGIYTENGVTYIAEFCREVFGVGYTNQLKNLVVEKIEADNYIDSETFFNFNKDLDIIPVENGLLNIRSLELFEFTPKKIFFAKIPVTYNPNIDCPLIKKFIEDICGDIQDVETIQQFIGSCLVREQRWEKMLMCIGGGRNGKSKLAELVKTFLGGKSVTGLQPSSFEDPENFQIHMLHGKFVNMYMDISKKALKNTSLLKSLSGRETVTVPRKFKTALTFKNSCKFIFGANELPLSYDITDGFWGRWLLINLPYTFIYEDKLAEMPAKDKHKYKVRYDDIIERITSPDELSGMLNWVLFGLNKLLGQNGFSYKYTTEEVKSLWVRKSDSFMSFYMDCCVDNFESKVPKQELQKAYISYCKEHGIKISTSKRISNALNDLGCYDGRFRGHSEDFNYWENIGFKPLFLNETDTNGFQFYKKPSIKEKVFHWVKEKKECRVQDLKIRFSEKVINKLLENGDLIQIKKDVVRLNK